MFIYIHTHIHTHIHGELSCIYTACPPESSPFSRGRLRIVLFSISRAPSPLPPPTHRGGLFYILPARAYILLFYAEFTAGWVFRGWRSETTRRGGGRFTLARPDGGRRRWRMTTSEFGATNARFRLSEVCFYFFFPPWHSFRPPRGWLGPTETPENVLSKTKKKKVHPEKLVLKTTVHSDEHKIY